MKSLLVCAAAVFVLCASTRIVGQLVNKNRAPNSSDDGISRPKGEGLVGLTRAFMYAGAPRVVASLCQVSNLATAELMKWFHAGMLKRRLTAAAALRAVGAAVFLGRVCSSGRLEIALR